MQEEEFKKIYEKAVKAKYPSAEFLPANNRIGYSYRVTKKKDSKKDLRSGLLLFWGGGLFYYLFYSVNNYIRDFFALVSITSLFLTFLFMLGSHGVANSILNIDELVQMAVEFNKSNPH